MPGTAQTEASSSGNHGEDPGAIQTEASGTDKQPVIQAKGLPVEAARLERRVTSAAVHPGPVVRRPSVEHAKLKQPASSATTGKPNHGGHDRRESKTGNEAAAAGETAPLTLVPQI